MEAVSSHLTAGTGTPVFVLGNPAPRPLPEDQASHDRVESGEVACHRCGSGAYRDVPIHNGRTVRRDCARCGRFLDFPVWHAEKLVGRRRPRVPRKPR